MATNDVRRKELSGDVTEDSSLRSGSRKRGGRWPGTTVFLLLGSLFALAMAAIGCRAPAKIGPGLRTATPGLPTPTPVVPTATPVLPTSTPVVLTATPVLPTLTPVVPTATPGPSTLVLPTPTAVVSTASPPSQMGGEAPTETRIAEGEPISEDTFAYAMGLAVPEDKARAGNVDELRTAFRSLRELGINIVVQSFAPRSTETDWKAYLDEATQENMKAIVIFRKEPPAWDGNNFDWGINRVFLESMKDHPALYAFFMIDEPFHRKHGWTITTERLQLLYQQAKGIAPNVPVLVQFSKEIQRAEEGQYPPQFAFKGGMCDICAISALEFRNEGQGDLFYSDELVSNHTISRAVIRREDPDAEIWTTVQVFGSVGRYYMPSADELQQMVDLLLSPELQAAGALDGMMWHQWASFYEARDASQHALGDPEFEALRNIVKDTAKDLGLLK